MATKRTDIHRPGAIVPRAYVHILDYATASSVPFSAEGIDCKWDHMFVDPKTGAIIKYGEHAEHGRCCITALREIALVTFASTGGTGKCSVCGARFVYGSVWMHVPTGEHIHIGHECVEKYELVQNNDAWNAAIEALKTRRAAKLEELRRDAALEAFLAGMPFMRDVLSHDNDICQDMRQKVRRWGSLSEKQVDFACSIYSRALCPERPKAAKVPAPEGRVEVEGVIISRKSYESAYGMSTKITVKVDTAEGEWLCWGSSFGPEPVGSRVRFRATLTRTEDAHFAVFKRPVDLSTKAA